MGGRCDEGVMKNIAHVSSVGLLYLFGFTSFPLRTFNYTKPNSLSALVLYLKKKKRGEWSDSEELNSHAGEGQS